LRFNAQLVDNFCGNDVSSLTKKDSDRHMSYACLDQVCGAGKVKAKLPLEQAVRALDGGGW
jgi:hypothetical protein